MTVSPKVEFVSSAESPVMVSAKVFYDKERLSLEAEPRAAERVSSSTKLQFEFKPVQTNFGIDEQNPDTIPDKLRYN